MAETLKPCLVIGSAPISDVRCFPDISSENYFVICADGGLDFALRHHLVPDLVVGDFDSAVAEPPQGLETIRLPVDKDDTDLLFAVKEGLRRGYQEFRILGALGARIDHSYANFCVLQYLAQHDAQGVLEDEDTWITLLHPGKRVLELHYQQPRVLSVFPFGVSSCTLSYSGLRYPLEQGVLKVNEPIGVSNVVESSHAEIILQDGAALVMLMKQILA